MENPRRLILALFAFNSLASAFWRMPCERSGAALLDPIVDTGKIGSHNHVIHGGTNFGMNTQPSDLLQSPSTSCQVTQDKSAYWTPSLHFMYPNGTTVMVEQVGGMLAYYLLYSNPGSDSSITAFPEGFKMLAGDPFRRNFSCAVPEPPKSDWTGYEVTQEALAQKALGFNCLNYQEPPEPSLGRHFMPDKEFLDSQCTDGIRLEIMFPSCWVGGDNLDPPDHKSHMAYPDLVMTGTCPEGFSVKTPSIFFETIWNTYAFSGVDGQFLFAHGDPTGYGYHGDYMPAWENNMLQEAVDTCTNLSGEIQDCPLFDIQSQAVAASNQFPMPAELASQSNPEGPLEGLPGGVPSFAGPEQAPIFPGNSEYAAIYPPLQSGDIVPQPPAYNSDVTQVMGAAPVNVVSPYGEASANTYTLLPSGSPTPASSSAGISISVDGITISGGISGGAVATQSANSSVTGSASGSVSGGFSIGIFGGSNTTSGLAALQITGSASQASLSNTLPSPVVAGDMFGANAFEHGLKEGSSKAASPHQAKVVTETVTVTTIVQLSSATSAAPGSLSSIYSSAPALSVVASPSVSVLGSLYEDVPGSVSGSGGAAAVDISMLGLNLGLGQTGTSTSASASASIISTASALETASASADSGALPGMLVRRSEKAVQDTHGKHGHGHGHTHGHGHGLGHVHGNGHMYMRKRILV